MSQPLAIRPTATSQLLLLTIAITAAVYAKAAVGPLQETMRLALALSDNQIALLQGPALGLPIVTAAIPLGLVIDRYSRVRLVVILVAISMMGSILTSVAASFALLFAARALVGLAAFSMSPAVSSLLADLYAPAQRGRAGMVTALGQFGGVSAVFAVGGILVTSFGSEPDAWRWAMFWLTEPPLLVVLVLVLALREPRRSERAIENPTARASFVEFWRYRAVIVPPMAGVVMAEIALGSVLIWATPTLSRTFALRPDRVGAIMGTALLVSGVIGSIAGGFLADHCHRSYGPRRTISVLSGLALLSVPAGLFGIMPEVAVASTLLVMLIAILIAILIMGTTLLIVAIPNELRGLCNGVVTALGATIGVGLAPVLVSLLSGAIGGPSMIGKSLALVCVTASLLCAATFAFGRRYFPRTSVR